MEWAPWCELTVVLVASVPVGLIGALRYGRGVTSMESSHHAVAMAEYLDRAQVAAQEARSVEGRTTVDVCGWPHLPRPPGPDAPYACTLGRFT